ncbi:MAG: glycine hydroxymethyltransferase, partial [Thermoproteota archaeon]|nr:glycine hydroxymethyltransferase [Thermoproteota archaeon]
EYLCEKGFKVLGEANGFTRSHQIAVDIQDYGGGKVVAEALEEANIILNKNLLPSDNKNDKDKPSGLRIGFQDVTRRGFKEDDIKHLCDLIISIVKGKKKPDQVKQDVITLRKEFDKVKYGFQNVNEAIEYAKKIRKT